MEGTALAGIVTGIAGGVSAVATAWINRGAAAGLAELRTQMQGLVGVDGKHGPDTEIGKLKARLAVLETAIPSAAALAALPGQFTELRAFVAEQLRLALARVEQAERVANRAPRTRTGEQPALQDVEARRGVEDALRRLDALERGRDADRETYGAIQLQLKELDTILGLLMDGRIALGGKSR